MTDDTLTQLLSRIDEHFAHKEHVASEVLRDIQSKNDRAHEKIVERLDAFAGVLAEVQIEVKNHGKRLDIANGRTAKNEQDIKSIEIQHVREVTKMKQQIEGLSGGAAALNTRSWEVIRFVLFAVMAGLLALII